MKTSTMQQQIKSIWGPIFHVCFLFHHVYVFLHADKVRAAVEEIEATESDHRILDLNYFAPVFFTNWNLMMQAIYFALSIFFDVLHFLSLYPKLKYNIGQWKGFLYMSLVFPSSIFVSTLFWSVYTTNREWVFPVVCDKFVPGWLNHSCHTLIVIFLIIEGLFNNQMMPSFKTAVKAFTILTVVYYIAFFATYFIYGRYVYILFQVLSPIQRVIFVVFWYSFSITVMKLGFVIENFKYSLSRSRAKKLT